MTEETGGPAALARPGVRVIARSAQRFEFTTPLPPGPASELWLGAEGIDVDIVSVAGNQSFIVVLTNTVEMNMGTMTLAIQRELERIWTILHDRGIVDSAIMPEPIAEDTGN